MKVKVVCIFIFLLSLMFPAVSFATSGACSWHDGVDCDAGADWDGSVICNDGWTDSSVSYSSMSECSSSWLTTDQISYLYYYHSIDSEKCLAWPEKYKERTLIFGEGNAAWGEYFFGPEEKAYMVKCSACYERDEKYNLILKEDLTDCLSIKSNDDYLFESTGVSISQNNVTPSQLCQDSYGDNSYSSGDQNADGTYSCYCDNGYEWNASNTGCVETIATSSNYDTSPVDMVALCKSAFGAHSAVINGAYGEVCGCEEGFVFNKGYACIKDIGDLENPFNDVFEYNRNLSAIIYLYHQGIINGYEGNVFKPYDEVNRAELVKILVEGKGQLPDVNTYNNCFTDVKDEWFAPYVCYAEEQGWIDGYPGGSFKPEQIVNKFEAVKILLSSQGTTIPTGISEEPFDDIDISAWYAPFVSEAKQIGILEETGSLFNGANGMTRGGVCENLFRLLTY